VSISRSIIQANEGAVSQLTCGELIGDCIVRFFEVLRAGWVKATQTRSHIGPVRRIEDRVVIFLLDAIEGTVLAS
jgi:hypothetical protein